jgi:hypothetical protein
MIMSRYLPDVIDEMYKVIPFVKHLESIKQSAKFAAPEIQYLFWQKLSDLLQNEIGEPTEDWQKELQNIFVGENT